MTQLESKLQEIAGNSSVLNSCFASLAAQYAVKGTLPKTKSLGKLNPNQLAEIGSMIGYKSITGSEKKKLVLERFYNSADIDVDEFADALLKVYPQNTGRTQTDNSIKKLQLQFPELSVTKVFTNLSEENLTEAITICRTAMMLLERQQDIRLSNLGVEAFKDSKTLRKGTRLYNLLGNLLREYFEEDELTRADALERCLVVENKTAPKVVVYGDIKYTSNGKTYDWISSLHKQKQAAVLTLQNIETIDSIITPSDTIITCENETPFNELMDEELQHPVVYISGYPNIAVCRFLKLLSVKHILHWGDTDFDGLRIASILNDIIPVTLWRCDSPTATKHKASLIPMKPTKQKRALSYLNNHPAFPFKDDLLFSLQNGWLEQEAWKGPVCTYF